ncbi:MAG: DUF460 domain-containing protein [Candidatus Hermodarchaeota archaeon]
MMVERARKSFVFGIDILPGSSPHKHSQSFSFTNMASDRTILEQRAKISFHDLLELVKREKPNFIAVDNIFELIPTSKLIYKLTARLASETKLLQVCGSPVTGYEKTSTLAKRYLNYTSIKFTPLETSFIVASLAIQGIGFIVEPFEQEAKVTVTRQRRAKQGGMSQKRYNTNAEIAVKRGKRVLKDQLDNLSMDYDIYEYPPHRAVFYIRLEGQQIEEIHRIAKELTTDMCRVQVIKVRKNQIEFIPLKSPDTRKVGSAKKIRNLIVGIDPGTTTGIAILDLNGHVLTTTSRREFSTAAILRFILEHGKAVVIASDVREPVPKTVEKLAKITVSVLISPRNPQTSQVEKRTFIAEYIHLCRDSHSRDALFAALKAYNSVKTKLIRTKKVVFNEYPDLLPVLDRIRADVLKNKSIENAINDANKLLEKPAPDLAPVEEKSTLESLKYQKEIIKQNHEIEELRLELEYYRENMKSIKRSYDRLSERYDRLKRQKSFELERDKRITEEKRRIAKLERKYAELEKQNYIQRQRILELQELRIEWEKGRWIPLSGLPLFSEEEIRRSSIRPGSVVVIENPSGGGSKTASLLIDAGIRAVIIPHGAPEPTDRAKTVFFETGVPVIPMKIGKGIKALEIVKKEEKIYIGEREVLESIIQEVEASIKRQKQINEDKEDAEIKSEEFNLEAIIKEANQEWIRRKKILDRQRRQNQSQTNP